jgi:tRNA(fMet)-specific endonuclease VapC
MSEPQGEVARRVAALPREDVCTSIVVIGEVKYGIERRGSKRLGAQLDRILTALDVEPVEVPTDQRYAEVRSHLERVGRPIGANDMLIAAHALALDACVVTDNIAEFQRVPGLKVENWLR